MKPVLDAISGLSRTASNYEEAIAILKKRFGNKQQIINRPMDILVYPFSAKDVLTDFTLSNARRFYSSKGNPLALEGLMSAQ